jgi:glutamate dehydrogenase
MKSKSAVEARVAEIVAELGNGGSEEATLAALMFEDAVAEDLRPYSTEELAGLARSALSFLKERKPGRAKVRVVEPEDHIGRGAVTVIEMANDDMPFIVDSSLALLTERGYEILLVLHPIVSVRRIATGALEAISPERHEGDGFIRESFVHIHVGKLGQDAERQEVHRELLGVLGDVRTAVLDWRPMQSRLQRAMADYHKNPPPLPVEELIESSAFLEWLLDNHFTFLGMREYEFVGGAGEGELKPIEGSGLGILRNPDAHVLRRGTTMVSMTPEIRAFLLQPAPLIITKSDAQATVHRRAAMDYIGVKQFDPQGELVGELRMVGLFTSTAYTRSPRDVPLIRRKISNILANSGFSPTSHSGKGLLHVLENFPREELFQVDAETLGDMARGILRLEERPRIRLFERHDKFDRFVSAFVFLPRDRYSTEVRIKVGDRLAEAFGGEVSGFAPSFGETTLVRVHYTISRHEGARPEPDLAMLEGEIAEIVRTWDERLAEAIAASFAPDQAIRLDRAYRGAFRSATSTDSSPPPRSMTFARSRRLWTAPRWRWSSTHLPTMRRISAGSSSTAATRQSPSADGCPSSSTWACGPSRRARTWQSPPKMAPAGWFSSITCCSNRPIMPGSTRDPTERPWRRAFLPYGPMQRKTTTSTGWC